MSNHPIIKALQEELAKEKDLAYLDWLFPLKYGISNRDEVIKTHQYKRRLDYETYNVGHEAATARLLGLLEKAVEMAEFYGDRENWNIANPEGKAGFIRSNDFDEFDFGGKKAREFLTTLADASGDMNKEIK